MKSHRLYIEQLGDDFDFGRPGTGYYSKGHHDFEEFAQAVMGEAGINRDEVGDPQHEWWRWNPNSEHLGDYAVLMAQGTEGRRGSFPVTVVWF